MRRAPAALALLLLLGGCSSDEPEHVDKGAREIAIRTTDQLRFDPAQVSATAGESVTFVVTNPGAVAHEFAIGDAAFHDAHAPTVASATALPTTPDEHAGHMTGGTSVSVPAGQTARVTFTMPVDGAPTYACHLASHDKAGMTGQVRYTGG